MPIMVFAYSDYIVAGGENIGLHINNNGVIISGFYKINNIYPGHDANLKIGDTITKVNNNEIKNIDEFINEIKDNRNDVIDIKYIRNGKKYDTKLKLIYDGDVLKTGLYVKDMVSGIGTLTFIDPNTNKYGALGHEVTESTSGVILEVKDGMIYESSVTSIEKSIRGEPGSKNATVNSKIIYGNINENTQSGIFGDYTHNLNNDKLYKVGKYQDIKTGSAKIITVLDKDIKKEYSINIIKVNNNKKDNKNILFELTDEELLKKTGGIVQGMSGSPIIQDDKIIGAVNNVVVNDPKKGYGILITTMLEESEN